MEREPEVVELQPGASQMVLTLASKTGMSPSAAFREIIDNSLDAGASNITITYRPKDREIEIRDDGRGASNIEAIVTPYFHKGHSTTLSGRYGIGGTASAYWLVDGRGKIQVESVSTLWDDEIMVDLAEIVRVDKWRANKSRNPNTSRRPTGTTITLTGCRDLSPSHVGAIYREAAFTFAPALRRGVSIVFDSGGKAEPWKPFTPPDLKHRQAINIEVDGHKIRGHCGIVKPGQANPVKGWAVIFGHRIIGRYGEPAGDRPVDLGLIYGEIVLPSGWANINDHKDGFKEDPAALWAAVAEACGKTLGKAEQAGHSIELNATVREAQDLLDMATGFAGPGIKGRRPNKNGVRGTVRPAGTDREHRKFTYSQPGDKPSSGRPVGLPRRIIINFSPQPMETSYEVRPESGRVRVLLADSHPSNARYKAAGSGEELAAFVALAVAADASHRPEHYLAMFPEMNTEHIPLFYDQIQARIRRPKEPAECA